MIREEFLGLSYPDRMTMCEQEGAQLTIFVPKGESLGLSGVAPRSGIVGQPYGEGRHLIHYEGWVHGAFQYSDLDTRGRWQAAVRQAAGRAFVEYPTIARRLVDTADLVQVGLITAPDVVTIHDEDVLRRWLA